MRGTSLIPREEVFEPIRALTQEVDRMFHSVLGDWAERVPARFRFDWGEWQFSPRIDVMDRGNLYELRAEVPGFSREDLQVDVTENAVTLKGERKEEELKEGESYLYRETRAGSFERVIRLPEEIRVDGVTAKLKDGVLTMTLPKVREEHRRKVEVITE
ncbi:Hsp20/alpha crystallin family protein [Deferrisoma palaeochoriense]